MFKKLKKKTKRYANNSKDVMSRIISLPLVVMRFLKGVWQELKLVSWLTKRATIKWSTAVLVSALTLAGLIVLLDIAFYNLRNLLLSI